MSAQKALTEAREKAGGNVAIARALAERGVRITSQAISQWDRVPAERVIDVESVTGVSRDRLRPDLYPSEPAVKPAPSEAAA